MTKKIISLVTPVFNEAENIEIYYKAVSRVIEVLQPDFDFEFIFTDNCSTDETFQKIRMLAKRDSRVRGFRFSRNFGYQKSIYTGYLHAMGDAAIQLDVDLQDPPEMIPQFIEAWSRGSKVVYGVRRSRKEGLLITQLRKLFYRIVSALSEYPLPHDAGDFRLVDRQVLEELKKIQDSTPYLRGTISTLGFEQTGIPYDRCARKIGESKFSYSNLMSLAIDGIVSNSVVPLRFATYTGLIVATTTMLGVIAYSIGKIVTGAEWPRGFATLTILILFSISLNGIFLGIIGEYLARIYAETKRRPLTIIAETV